MRAKTLVINREQMQAIEHAAEMVRRLRKVERAHALDDEMEVEAMLEGVDPIEASIVENALYAIVAVWHAVPDLQFRGGKGEPPVSATPALPPSRREPAPVTTLHSWFSRRVPDGA